MNVRMRLVALILMLTIPNLAVGGVWGSDYNITNIGKIQVRLMDDATDGCWTNIKEVKVYAEDKLEMIGADVMPFNNLLPVAGKENTFDRFVGVNAEVSDKEIDSRAVSILRGTITHVRDGDTFEVQGTPVRISALDCPENSTSSGQKATRFTKQFKGKQAVCELTGAKTYDRVVGYCSIEGKDFAQIMVDNKFCKFWPKYDVWNRY